MLAPPSDRDSGVKAGGQQMRDKVQTMTPSRPSAAAPFRSKGKKKKLFRHFQSVLASHFRI